MSKKVKKRVLQLPLSIAMVVIVALGCLAITVFSGVKPIFWLIALPSIYLTVQLTALFHEFGHYLSAVKNGFEVYYFSFSNFILDKYGRKKFKMSFSSEHLGEIRFYPKKEGRYHKSLEKALIGGLLGNCLIAVILNALLVLSLFGVFGTASPYLSIGFSFSPYALYAWMVNAIAWFHPENDGSQVLRLRRNENERQAVDNFYSIQKSLFDGKSYVDIPKGFFTVEKDVSPSVKIPLTVYALRRAIESRDDATATAIACVLEGEEFSENEIYFELLYKYLIDGNDEKVKEYESVLSFCYGETPIEERTLLAYAKYRGDEEYIKTAKPTAIKICDKQKSCQGDALYNKKLIELI